MSPHSIQLPDPARLALAVDALCVGSPVPVLVHAEVEPNTDSAFGPFALFCTPLHDLEALDDTIEVLAAVTVPRDWKVAGVCAPARVKSSTGTTVRPSHFEAWIIHVVTRSGSSVSRLSVPDALELSGPMDVIDQDHPLHRCLRRLVRIDGTEPGGDARHNDVSTHPEVRTSD